ncbi:MAG TPA: fimbria/pilus outer membrane usher protein [Ramlibacter sp.]
MLARAVLCCVLAGAAAAPAAERAPGSIATESMVLRVRLNTLEKGDFFVERTTDNDFLVKVSDLKAIGFRDPAGKVVPVDGEPYMSLRSMQGVSSQFEERGLILSITADPRLLPSQSIKASAQRTEPQGVVPAMNSAFANYAFAVAGGDLQPTTYTFAGEAGVTLANLLLRSDANTVLAADGRRKLVRLNSSLTHDDRDQLRRTVIGDFFTPARDFSTGASLGGVSVSRVFGLNPYFIQFPAHSVGGTVAVPSDLEVYLDGQRIRTERLRPGEFEIRDILAYGGARNVQLILRDAFGRVQKLDYSFYFSDQPLRRGVHEYSYNAGWMRRAYGAESNRYGPPAFTMFHRYGLSDRVTLGWRAEATEGMVNAGPLATAVLGSAGVASIALARSAIAGRYGGSGLASYAYQTRNWGVGASLRRDWGHYAALGDPPVVTNRRSEASISASHHLRGIGNVALGHSFLHTDGGVQASNATPLQPYSILALPARRTTSLSYSLPLVSGRASLSATFSHVKDAGTGSRNEAFVGLTVFFDRDHSGGASYRSDGHSQSASLQVTRRQPIGEGLGYTLSATAGSEPAGGSAASRSSLQYNAAAAVVRADAGRARARSGQWLDDYRLSLAGGVGLVGGNVAAGRPITGSFGIVKVGELPGVKVSVNGQPVGVTSARGQVFVPALTSFYDNQVSLGTENVPIEYSFQTTVKAISPPAYSGVLVEFGVARIQALTGTLGYDDGGYKPVEFQEVRIETPDRTLLVPTGRGGEFYLENMQAGTYRATTRAGGKPCAFDLVVPASKDTFVELGSFTCRQLP